jgi:hypothetical protein
MVPVEYCQCKANPNNCTSNIYPMDEVCSVEVDFFPLNGTTQPVYSFPCKLKTNGNITCNINLTSPFPLSVYGIGIRQKLNPGSPVQGLSNSFSVLFSSNISISALTPAHTSIDCDFTLVPPSNSIPITEYYTNTYDIEGCITSNSWSTNSSSFVPPSQDAFYKVGTGDMGESLNSDFGQDGIVESADYSLMEHEVLCPGLPYPGQPPGTGCILGGVGQVADLDGSGGKDLFDYKMMEISVYSVYYAYYPFYP